MSPNKHVADACEIRTRDAYLFDIVVEIYRLYDPRILILKYNCIISSRYECTFFSKSIFNFIIKNYCYNFFIFSIIKSMEKSL